MRSGQLHLLQLASFKRSCTRLHLPVSLDKVHQTCIIITRACPAVPFCTPYCPIPDTPSTSPNPNCSCSSFILPAEVLLSDNFKPLSYNPQPIQILGALCFYVWPRLSLSHRLALGPVHRFWGMAAWLAGLGAVATGLQEKVTFLQMKKLTCEYLEKGGGEGGEVIRDFLRRTTSTEVWRANIASAGDNRR